MTLGDRDFDMTAAHLQYSLELGGDAWDVSPLIDIGYTDVESDGFTETGTGTAELVIEKASTSFVTGRAAVKVGAEWVAGNDTLIRPFVNLGYTTFLDDENIEIWAALAGAPEGVEPFMQWHELDENFTDANAGVEIMWPSNFTATLGFNGKYGDTWDTEAWYLKLLKGFE